MTTNTMTTNDLDTKEIPASYFAAVAKCYAADYAFNLKHNIYDESKMEAVVTKSYDIGTEPVRMVWVSDRKLVVVDQPRNFKDVWASVGQNKIARASLMRGWFSCHIVHISECGTKLCVERECWHGGRLNKDEEKAEKQFAKFIKKQREKNSCCLTTTGWQTI